MINSWGYHLTLDCKACDIPSVMDYDNIWRFTKRLVKDIDMVAYGDPQIVHFGSGDKTGYTLVQLIETSNICAHFIDSNGNAYIDVFSCKTFDNDVVVKLVQEYFKPERIKTNFIFRDADAE
jgi:S-adenosylmethionine/arginine decarboxylase-like enzyme